MEIQNAVRRLAALAQDTRLRTFRALVQAGPDGMAAGAIAERLAVPHNTLSSHLNTLVNAGLLQARREGRSILYSVDFPGTRSLLEFLMEDCCRAPAGTTRPVLEAIRNTCCAKTTDEEPTP